MNGLLGSYEGYDGRRYDMLLYHGHVFEQPSGLGIIHEKAQVSCPLWYWHAVVGVMERSQRKLALTAAGRDLTMHCVWRRLSRFLDITGL